MLYLVVEALGKIGHASAIPALLPLLHDEEWQVRRLAVEALGKIGHASAVAALLEIQARLARLDEEWQVRLEEWKVGWEAAEALGEDIGLMPEREDEDWLARDWVVEALGEIDDAPAVPALHLAAEAVVETGHASAAPALLEMLMERLARLDMNWLGYCLAVEALGETAEASPIPTLVALLQINRPEVRDFAVEALGEIGEASAVPALLEMLDDMAAKVGMFYKGVGKLCSVVEALGKIGHASAAPTLVALLQINRPQVRDCVVEALGEIGHASAVPALLALLHDEEWQVRLLAVEALGKIGERCNLRVLLPSGPVESLP